MVLKEDHGGTIIIRKCVRENCKTKPPLNDYYFCPDCMAISKTIPFEILFLIIKNTFQKFNNSKTKISSFDNDNLKKLYNDLGVILQTTLFIVFFQKEFFEGKQETEILEKLNKSSIVTTLKDFETINENFMKSVSRYFLTDIHFTFDAFFERHSKEENKDTKHGGFYKMVSSIFESLNIPSMNNPFLALSIMRNANHNFQIYKNTVYKNKQRVRTYDLLNYSIGLYKLKFEHGEKIEYGPLVHELYLFEKGLNILEEKFIPRFYKRC